VVHTGYKVEFEFVASEGSILSVESNQNMQSKTKNVESKTEKCEVQNSILTSRNQLSWALTNLIQYNLHSSSFQTEYCFCTKFGQLILRKIIITVATRCQILYAPKSNFGWGSAPDPAGGAYSAPPDSLAGFQGAYF